jgi:ubiquinone/menaquinone biosynthesis C-methylase UbiE
MSLLPENHSEFRSKQYWDEFFLKRGQVAFEWYGEYNELHHHLVRSVRKEDQILVIGCGNSNFSTDFYDKGFHNLINLDFSELVIDEMKNKTTDRKEMKWVVGDMTDLSTYSDSSINVVFDKGALDALMSTDSTDVRDKAAQMFSEIQRVLAPGGKYICITLAEHFIIESLLTYFNPSVVSGGWSITVDCVTSKKDSPFLPFYVEISKATSSASNDIKLFVDQFGTSLRSGSTAAANTASAQTVYTVHTAEDAITQLTQIQAFHRKQYELGKLELGKFEKLHFYSYVHPDIPRFTMFLLDHAENATLSMAVFMVPSGRESDYTFTTAEGLESIAAQANCKRLIAVCCNRPHSFPTDPKILQEELNPLVLSLKLKNMDAAAEKIPYLAINAENDWEVIDSGVSPESGEYIIEESIDEDVPNTVLRRLIFLQNQNFIQTEVRLKVGGGSGGSNKSSKAAKGKKKPAKKTPSSGGDGTEFELDYTYLDLHHCAALCALTALPHVIHGAHKTTNPAAAASSPTSISNTITALLIGLGGGALPMVLQRYLPNLHLWTCDLDSSVEAIARTHFGFKCNARSSCFVHEGVAVVEALFQQQITGKPVDAASSVTVPTSLMQASLLDVLFVDADSKDTTLGISAPPASFITLRTLIMIHSILKPGGAVHINVVARSKPQLAQLMTTIAAVFGVQRSNTTSDPDSASASTLQQEIAEARAQLGLSTSTSAAVTGFGKLYHILASKDTMNEGLLAVKASGSGTTPAASKGTSKLADNFAREEQLEAWLKVRSFKFWFFGFSLIFFLCFLFIANFYLCFVGYLKISDLFVFIAFTF